MAMTTASEYPADAKSKGIAVAVNPAPSVKDQPLRDPNDVYVSPSAPTARSELGERAAGADRHAGRAVARNHDVAVDARLARWTRTTSARRR
jgi:hypothetical protein